MAGLIRAWLVRAGRGIGGGGTDWAVLAALLVIGCLAFWFGVKKDAGPLVIGGATLLGLAGSVGYERRIGGVLRLAALGGGCVFWMGAVVVWSGVARPVLESFGAWHRVTLGTIYVLPVFGLPIGAGAMAWYQAIADTHRGRFDWSRVFPASIASCAGMIVVGLLVCLSVLLGATRIPHSARFSVMTAAICVGVTGAIWLVVLKRIAGLRPRHGLRAIVAWVVLIVLFPLTFGLAGLIEGADGWGQLVVVVSLPVAIGTWLFIALAVPRLLGWVIGADRRGVDGSA